MLILVIYFSGLSALVTIKPVELGEKPGISGKFDIAMESKRGNTDKNVYNLGIRLQYDNNKNYVLWSDFSGSYAEVSGKTNTNKIYGHIRYIHSLYDKKLNWEIFEQIEANEFTKVKERRLSGIGIRYRLLHSYLGKLYFGLGGFNEHIAYTTDIDKYETNVRFNSYIAYTKKFDKKSTLTYVSYYQPKVENFFDFMLSNRIELKIKIYSRISLSMILYYDIDSKPAIGVKKEDITQKTSFTFAF